jgi:hypothetical protein
MPAQVLRLEAAVDKAREEAAVADIRAGGFDRRRGEIRRLKERLADQLELEAALARTLRLEAERESRLAAARDAAAVQREIAEQLRLQAGG